MKCTLVLALHKRKKPELNNRFSFNGQGKPNNMNMLVTPEKSLTDIDIISASTDLIFDKATNQINIDSLLNSEAFEDHGEFEDIQGEQWLRKLENDWECIASDTSVQYKLMGEHYQPLHTNNLAINIERIKTIGEYKVIDITRCSYEARENKTIRVSVNAKLVLGLKSNTRH